MKKINLDFKLLESVKKINVLQTIKKANLSNTLKKIDLKNTIKNLDISNKIKNLAVISKIKELNIPGTINKANLAATVKKINLNNTLKKVNITSTVKKLSSTALVKKITLLSKFSFLKKEVRLIPFKVQEVYKDANEIPQGVEMINAPAIWEESKKGAGVVVAVLDTGCQTDHPDLKDQIIGGYNFTKDYSGDVTNFNDNNGHGTHV